MQRGFANGSRYAASLFVFAVFCLLAGGSAEESAEDKKARILKAESISEQMYDSRVREFGSYDDYKAAQAKGMNAAQYANYKAQKDACKKSWSSCADNEQLVNEWFDWSKVQVACKVAANDRAKFGDPEWPWLSFSTFLKGNDYIKMGRAVAIEPDAKFKNGFNASVRSRVTCFYDLKADRVQEVMITER
jgi:hypothetical protein